MRDPASGDPVTTVANTPIAPVEYENIKAISWLLVSVVASSAMTIAVRVMSFDLDPRMIVLLRFGITAILLLVAIIALSDLRAKLSFSHPRLHVIRGLCMAVSTHLGFYAIANMELVTVTVLFFMVPIFATALSGFLNGEHAGPRRLAAIAVSFIGVLLILKPGYQPLNTALERATCSACLAAPSNPLCLGRCGGSCGNRVDPAFGGYTSLQTWRGKRARPDHLPASHTDRRGGLCDVW